MHSSCERMLCPVSDSKLTIARKISSLVRIEKGPDPGVPFLRIGHRLLLSFRTSASQFRKSKNGRKLSKPLATKASDERSLLTTVHVQQPNLPDAHGGAVGAFMMGHSPDAPRYNASKALQSILRGRARTNTASHTSVRLMSQIGRNMRYRRPPSNCHCQTPPPDFDIDRSRCWLSEPRIPRTTMASLDAACLIKAETGLIRRLFVHHLKLFVGGG